MSAAPHQPRVVRVFNSSLAGARTATRHSSPARAAKEAPPSVKKIARRETADTPRARAPGDLLVRPLAVMALTVLIVNDHVLKPRWPGLLTGKLSDIAGLVFLPLLIVSLYELGRAALRKQWLPGGRGLVAIAAAVAIGFAATKLSPAVAATYGDVLGWLRWPLIGHWSAVRISPDPTDVLCTPCAIAGWIESRRLRGVRGMTRLGT